MMRRRLDFIFVIKNSIIRSENEGHRTIQWKVDFTFIDLSTIKILLERRAKSGSLPRAEHVLLYHVDSSPASLTGSLPRSKQVLL
jgi:hypothetical protein